MRITLIRHAKVLSNNQRIYPNEMGRWLDEYDLAEIETTLPKDNSLKEIIENSRIFCCSRLIRSRTSLGLYNKAPYTIKDIFNEIELPYPDKRGFIKLSPIVWRVIFRVAWFFGYSKNSESIKEAESRAEKALNLLIQIAEENDSDIVLVGHAILNRFISKELKKRNWATIKQLQNNNWGYGVFQSPDIAKE